ncbi:helix-turn-helix domain-containing protein [Streptomyces sp. NPDC051162]|uniref:helix-turn-helix domain-containing protein n=1 Tax=Streptomyces sp. NPDC051162 TaxID=3154747 RepID=UPI003417891E
MGNRGRHSAADETLPHLYRPCEIAEALGCSEWWVKEQARQRRIPFTRVGGAYRFTVEHFAEIIRAFEERPLQSRESEPQGTVAPRLHQSHHAVPMTVPLRAKRPRRVSPPDSPPTVA